MEQEPVAALCEPYPPVGTRDPCRTCILMLSYVHASSHLYEYV